MFKSDPLLELVNLARWMFVRACDTDNAIDYDVASVVCGHAAESLEAHGDRSGVAAARYSHLVHSLRDERNVAIARRDDRIAARAQGPVTVKPRGGVHRAALLALLAELKPLRGSPVCAIDGGVVDEWFERNSDGQYLRYSDVFALLGTDSLPELSAKIAAGVVHAEL